MTKISEAKKILTKYHIKSIHPTQLAKASKQISKSLLETLQLIAFLKSGGQGMGPFPYTQRTLKGRFI